MPLILSEKWIYRHIQVATDRMSARLRPPRAPGCLRSKGRHQNTSADTSTPHNKPSKLISHKATVYIHRTPVNPFIREMLRKAQEKHASAHPCISAAYH